MWKSIVAVYKQSTPLFHSKVDANADRSSSALELNGFGVWLAEVHFPLALLLPGLSIDANLVTEYIYCWLIGLHLSSVELLW